jgi:hypothetical protein
LKRKGIKKIIHRAEKTNNASIGLAKSLGYQFDGETKHQVRFSKVLNESEILNEALDFKVKLYHGSANKYKVLKAVSYNDGNRLQSKA